MIINLRWDIQFPKLIKMTQEPSPWSNISLIRLLLMLYYRILWKHQSTERFSDAYREHENVRGTSMRVILALKLFTLSSYLSIGISVNIFRSQSNMLFNLIFLCTCHEYKPVKVKNTLKRSNCFKQSIRQRNLRIIAKFWF